MSVPAAVLHYVRQRECHRYFRKMVRNVQNEIHSLTFIYIGFSQLFECKARFNNDKCYVEHKLH